MMFLQARGDDTMGTGLAAATAFNGGLALMLLYLLFFRCR